MKNCFHEKAGRQALNLKTVKKEEVSVFLFNKDQYSYPPLFLTFAIADADFAVFVAVDFDVPVAAVGLVVEAKPVLEVDDHHDLVVVSESDKGYQNSLKPMKVTW